MNGLDWSIAALYILFLIGIGFYLNVFQRDTEDYFLAGQRMKWWQTGTSTMATQLSAISFVSIPGFVAVAPNGGLKWLTYEFAVPIALILVMAVIIPVLHRGRYISMHQYLGERFDDGTRTLVSGIFLVARGAATGAIIFMGAKVVSEALGLSMVVSILALGVITIIYDVLGGIGVVIFSDVIQMGVILVGLLVCGGIALDHVGWSEAWRSVASGRKQVVIFSDWGLTEGGDPFSFWPMVFGGFILYASYYGCDQSQVQREMSVGDEDEVRKSMLLNAFARYPFVLIYCVVGLIVGATFLQPGVRESIAAAEPGIANGSELQTYLENNPDRMLPLFILHQLPHGLIGLLMVAIMAALMSSLDSAINSLSAITVKDFYEEYIAPDRTESHYLTAGRLCTFFWGTFAVCAALLFHVAVRQGETVVELINRIGSIFYGPLLAAFLLGIVTRWITARGMKWGVVVGQAAVVAVWLSVRFGYASVSFWWWNVVGFLVSTVVAAVISLGINRSTYPTTSELFELEAGTARTNWTPYYVLCVIYFFVIIGLSYGVERLALRLT